MRTERLAFGFLSLGMASVAFPVSLVTYAGAACLAIIATTACVGSGNWVCIGGPLVVGPVLGLLSLGLLGLVLLSALGLLVAGGALIRSRPAYVGLCLGLSVVPACVGVYFCALGYTASPGIEDPELSAALQAWAIGLPCVVLSGALIAAASIRFTRWAVAHGLEGERKPEPAAPPA